MSQKTHLVQFVKKFCFQTLPCLVRMCKRDCPIKDRVAGAETLAMLVEEDVNLQKTASMTDHLIPTIASYLNIKDRKVLMELDPI